ncbi:SSI family serine proteinase inhibitor [Streptomyces sp. INA 01156]
MRPAQGHPRAADACAELAAADGRISDIPAQDTICTMIYAPVTAHAHGQWRGSRSSTRRPSRTRAR